MEISVREYFAGRSVLITGGTGFIGKILIDKLVRSCPDINTVYVLIRPHKGKSATERLEELISQPVFERVNTERPGALQKTVKAIEGDVSELKLAISEDNLETIKENVSVVFHAAATVRFDQPIKEAILINTRGTREVVLLAKSLKNLSVFVHISTTYCNCDRKIVDEVVYPATVDWREAIYVAENVDDVTLSVIGKKYFGEFPNSYTLTKNLAEQIVAEECENIPSVILRPSIVISATKEPEPGWIDNFNGPVGLLLGVGKGIVRAIFTDRSAVPDYMPVDIAVKAFIVAAWKKGVMKKEGNNLSIYNVASCTKSVSMEEAVNIGMSMVYRFPFDQMLWIPGVILTRNRTTYYINVLFKQIIPAFMVDLVISFTKNKPIYLLKIQRKIYQASMALSYFTSKSWWFINENFLNLLNDITDADKEDFDFSFQHIDPEEYFVNAIMGGYKYLLKTEPQIPQALSKAKLFYWLDTILKTLFWTSMLYLMYFKIIYPYLSEMQDS